MLRKFKNLSQYGFFGATTKTALFLFSTHQCHFIQLKNGAVYDMANVDITLGSLRACMEKYPIAFRELVEKCRHPEFNFFGLTPESLKEFGLIKKDQEDYIYQIVRDTVLSCVEGYGCKMKIHDPLTPAFVLKR